MKQIEQAELTEEFIEACRHGWLDDIKTYIKQGVDISADDNMALFNAVNCDEPETVKLLIERGADIHADDDFALRHFASNGDNDMVSFLLTNGADIHAQDDYAVRMAAQNEHMDTLALIISEFGYIPDRLMGNQDNIEIVEIIAKVQLKEKLTKRLMMSQRVKNTSPNKKI